MGSWTERRRHILKEEDASEPSGGRDRSGLLQLRRLAGFKPTQHLGPEEDVWHSLFRRVGGLWAWSFLTLPVSSTDLSVVETRLRSAATCWPTDTSASARLEGLGSLLRRGQRTCARLVTVVVMELLAGLGFFQQQLLRQRLYFCVQLQMQTAQLKRLLDHLTCTSSPVRPDSCSLSAALLLLRHLLLLHSAVAGDQTPEEEDVSGFCPPKTSEAAAAHAHLESKQDGQREGVTADDQDAAQAEVKRRTAGREQRNGGSCHAERRQSQHGECQACTAPCWPGDGPDAPGQVAAQNLKETRFHADGGRAPAVTSAGTSTEAPDRPRVPPRRAGPAVVPSPTSRGPLYAKAAVSHSSMLALLHCSENSRMSTSGSAGSVCNQPHMNSRCLGPPHQPPRSYPSAVGPLRAAEGVHHLPGGHDRQVQQHGPENHPACPVLRTHPGHRL